ncbi:hypothetical protein IH879_13220 [candidate division KSB1 bacterium]|nr:hypothetical protein [candidate division KSB1 bacterium]
MNFFSFFSWSILPYDAVIAILTNWRLKNHPKENKGIITASEIEEQVGWAFKKNYTGYGCSEPIIESFLRPQVSSHFEKQEF